MKVIYLASALLLSAFAFAPASAAPAAPVSGLQASSGIVLARYAHRTSRDEFSAKKKKTYSHYHYVPGHHYQHAPYGWHRYHSRPRDWHARGCIVVGPIWFCP